MLEQNKKIKIAVLISGGGTNLQALIDAEKSGIIKSGEISLVISSKEDAYGLKRAENAGIRGIYLPSSKERMPKEFKGFKGFKGFEDELSNLIKENNIELIVLAGFMKILSEEFVKKYPNRIINVHPSLIPSFYGKGAYGLKVHEMALNYGVKVTGATVHFVNEIPDGGEILLQKAVYVEDDDTPEILQKRVMQEAEWILLPKAVEMVSKKIMEGEI